MTQYRTLGSRLDQHSATNYSIRIWHLQLDNAQNNRGNEDGIVSRQKCAVSLLKISLGVVIVAVIAVVADYEESVERCEYGPCCEPEDHSQTFQHEECDPAVQLLRAVHCDEAVDQNDS